MKHFLLLCLALGLLLPAGCANHHILYADPIPPNAAPADTYLRVISATFGSGENFVDVTSRVSELLHQPKLEFLAKADALQADPTPNRTKVLIIVFEFKGQRRLFATKSGGNVSLDLLLEHSKTPPG